MDALTQIVIFGLSTAAVYAVAASGLVVTYTTSGIFNLAHGATGMLAAFVYWQIRFDWNWPAPIALVVVLGVICPVFGAFLERVIMRGLQGTTEVVRLSVTVALLAASIGLANWVWPNQTSKKAFRSFYSGNTVSVFGLNVSWHKLIMMTCAIAVAVGLRVLLYRTRTGVAMRAVVDDRALSELNGGRPDRVALTAWALSASLAGLAGILLAGDQQLNIDSLVLIVVSAYAAAIIGRLRSLPLTFIGAVLLGLLDATYFNIANRSWFPKTAFGFSITGLRESIPTIVLFVVLIALPQQRLRVGVQRVRGDTKAPAWSTALVGCIVLVGFTAMVSGFVTRANTLYLVDGFLYALGALSLVPLTGYAGQVSLAPMTFAGLGAVCMAKLPGNGSLFSLLATMAIVAVIGGVVALPAVRLQGVYLALATGAFAVLCSKLVFNQQKTFLSGSVKVPPLRFPGGDLASPRSRMVGISVVFAVLAIAVIAVRRSALGRQMIALKDSPIASATLGMSIVRTKVIAFAMSAAIASCAGALVGRTAGPTEYDFLRGLPLVLLAVVGGVTSVAGALFGGLLLGGNVAFSNLLPVMKNVSKVTPGLIGISLGRNPQGAAGQTSESFRPLIGRWPLIGIALAGEVAIWGLTTKGTVSHWSFVVATMVWSLSGVSNLPAMVAARGTRRFVAATWLIVGVCLAAFVDWGDVIPSSGWRVLFIIAAVGLTGPVVARILGAEAKPAIESPDLAGLRGFTAGEVDEAEHGLGLVAV